MPAHVERCARLEGRSFRQGNTLINIRFSRRLGVERVYDDPSISAQEQNATIETRCFPLQAFHHARNASSQIRLCPNPLCQPTGEHLGPTKAGFALNACDKYAGGNSRKQQRQQDEKDIGDNEFATQCVEHSLPLKMESSRSPNRQVTFERIILPVWNES